MKKIVLMLAACALLLGFGCPGDGGGNLLDGDGGGEVNATPAVVDNGQGQAQDGNGTAEPPGEANITECYDGTPVGECSVTKPKICDVLGNLVDDAETCGCPENSLVMGRECIFNCEDGTLIGECAGEQPLYCNAEAELVEKAGECGCPPGYDVDGDGCINSCEDGTPRYLCSEETPPYYCDEEYELVMNPLLCGCNVWEFLLGTECFDPTSEQYVSGETIRITESVTMKVDDAEEINCDGNAFLKLRLTISNNGREAFMIEEKNFRVYRDEARILPQQPDGCSTAGMFKWGEISQGSGRSGKVWLRLIGGVGDYSVQYSHPFSATVIRSFNITEIYLEE